MTFGRKNPPGGNGNSGSSHEPHIQRFIDRLLLMFNTVSTLAEAIKNGQWQSQGKAIDPMTSPVDISGFSDLFAKTDNEGNRTFNYYFYLTGDEKLDPHAQMHLSDMISNLMVLNLTAHPANDTGPAAVDVAQIVPLIDRSFAQLGFFVAFFSNHKESAAIGLDIMTARSLTEDQVRGMLETMTARYQYSINEAQRRMFAPDQIQHLVPTQEWPVLSCGMGQKPHEGERIINEVYFPRQYAEPLMADLARRQGQAMAHAS